MGGEDVIDIVRLETSELHTRCHGWRMDTRQIGTVRGSHEDRADQGADTHIQTLIDILFLEIDGTEQVVAGKVITAKQTILVLKVVEVGGVYHQFTLQLVIGLIQETVLRFTDVVNGGSDGQFVLYHIGCTGGEVWEDTRVTAQILQGLVGHLPVVRVVLVLEDQIASHEVRVQRGLHTQADELSLCGTDGMGIDQIEIVDLIGTRRHVIIRIGETDGAHLLPEVLVVRETDGVVFIAQSGPLLPIIQTETNRIRASHQGRVQAKRHVVVVGEGVILRPTACKRTDCQ